MKAGKKSARSRRRGLGARVDEIAPWNGSRSAREKRFAGLQSAVYVSRSMTRSAAHQQQFLHAASNEHRYEGRDTGGVLKFPALHAIQLSDGIDGSVRLACENFYIRVRLGRNTGASARLVHEVSFSKPLNANAIPIPSFGRFRVLKFAFSRHVSTPSSHGIGGSRWGRLGDCCAASIVRIISNMSISD